jgi:phosphatidylglycerol---prolipoprotein diacylglyceryl transferase
MQPPFSPVLIEIGPLAIYWYGLLIATGILLGAQVAAFAAREAGRDPELIWDMLIVVVIFALIGARLYHVVSSPEGGQVGWDYYRANPLEIFALWHGGLGIYGAIIGGALGAAIFCLRRKLNFLRWLDFLALGMPLGQSIGRWGNFMNRELYGPPTDLPWGLHIPPAYRIAPYNDLTRFPESTRFHPTFLYESLATFALCILLLWIAWRFKDRRLPGDLLFGYLIGYGIIRFFIEYLRPDAWMAGTLAAAQLVGLAIIIIGAAAIILRHNIPTFKRSNV